MLKENGLKRYVSRVGFKFLIKLDLNFPIGFLIHTTNISSTDFTFSMFIFDILSAKYITNNYKCLFLS